MNAMLSDPYGLLIVCMIGGWVAVICAFAATEFMVSIFPPSPNHSVKRGASRMSNAELHSRLSERNVR
jgi:hypothetical protein